MKPPHFSPLLVRLTAIVFGTAMVISLGFSLIRAAFGAPPEFTSTIAIVGLVAIFFSLELLGSREAARYDAILREHEKRDAEE